MWILQRNFRIVKRCFTRTKLTSKSTNAGDDKPVIEKDAWKNLLTIFTMENGLTGSLLSLPVETKNWLLF